MLSRGRKDVEEKWCSYQDQYFINDNTYMLMMRSPTVTSFSSNSSSISSLMKMYLSTRTTCAPKRIISGSSRGLKNRGCSKLKSDAINRLSISVLHIRNSKDPTLQYGGPLQRGTTMTTEGQEDEIYFRS